MKFLAQSNVFNKFPTTEKSVDHSERRSSIVSVTRGVNFDTIFFCVGKIVDPRFFLGEEIYDL